MKLLLIAITLAFSAQTFASDCDLPNKKDFISAQSISCDNDSNEVLIEGISINKSGKQKEVAVDTSHWNTEHRGSKSICEVFGLSDLVSITYNAPPSVLKIWTGKPVTGIEIRFEVHNVSGNRTGKIELVERYVNHKSLTVDSIICTRE